MNHSIFKKHPILKYLGVTLFWVTLWFIVSIIVGYELLVPSPAQTITALLDMMKQSIFWKALIISIIRIMFGFLTALVLGSLLGIIAYHVPLIKALFDPFVNIIRATPVASFIVLAFVWIKTNLLPSFISVLIVLPLFYTCIQEGCSRIDQQLVELCNVMHATMKERLRSYVFPAVIPSYANACINGIGLAWKSGIAAEVICRPYLALGTLLSNSKNMLETSRVFAVTLVIVLLSIAFDALIKKLWRINE